MRHHNNIRKFNRKRNQRKALLRGLAISLVKHGKIETTEAKAKSLRSVIEKLITKANKGTLNSQRIIMSRLYNGEQAKKLINEIAPKYKNRKGGYTRITKLPRRQSDASKMAIIEFV
ncbi:MAG: 50S ribosomal protein L17 [Patescibacteria group bacterium]|nr:50S ribosomal protein L17 [Patescibacteria group bacterium]